MWSWVTANWGNIYVVHIKWLFLSLHIAIAYIYIKQLQHLNVENPWIWLNYIVGHRIETNPRQLSCSFKVYIHILMKMYIFLAKLFMFWMKYVYILSRNVCILAKICYFWTKITIHVAYRNKFQELWWKPPNKKFVSVTIYVYVHSI